MARQAQNVISVYYEAEARHVSEAIVQIALRAVTDAGKALTGPDAAPELPKAVIAHLSDIEDILKQDIARQTQRDIDTIRGKFKGVLLQANLNKMVNGGKRLNHLMGVFASDTTDLNFWFTDRSNRRWPSQKFIRTVWRQALLTVYNESYLMVLAAAGEAFAEVEADSPSDRFAGMVFGIDSQGAEPNYISIKDEVFHPNSNRVVKKRSKE